MDSMLWNVTHSPKIITDSIIDNKKKYIFYCFTKTKQFSNILVTGNTGTGKTSMLKYTFDQLYGKEYVSNNVLEIYPYNTKKKISELESLFYNFCSIGVFNPEEKELYPDYKIIFFDEIDNITEKIQQLILNVIEDPKFVNIRFAFTCNDITKVCDSIQSHCLIFHLKNPSTESIVKRLKKICMIEKVKSSQKGLKLISYISGNDVRASINLAQSISLEGDITEKLLSKLKGIPTFNSVEKLLIYCAEKDLKNAVKLTAKLLENGTNSYDIIYIAIGILKTENPINKKVTENQIIFLDKLGRLLNDITKGYNTNIQIIGTIADLCL